jgi:hypothetical protein
MMNTRQTSPSTTPSSTPPSPAASTRPNTPGDESFFDLPSVPESTIDHQEDPRPVLYRAEEEDEFDDTGSQATQDTEGIENPTNSGTFKYELDICLVIMSTNSGGSKLCCGYPAASCPRPRHADIRMDLDRRGKPGVYVGIPNSTGMTYDAILSSFTDPEEQQQQREADRLAATTFAQSQVKARAEALHSPKAGSATVAFDLSRQPEPVKRTVPSPMAMPRTWASDNSLKASAQAPTARAAPASSTANRTPSGTNRFPLPRPAATATPTKAAATRPPDPLIERFEIMHASMTTMMTAQLAIMEKMAQTQGKTTQEAANPQEEVFDISDDEEPRSSKPQKAGDHHTPQGTEHTFYAVARGRTPGIFTT